VTALTFHHFHGPGHEPQQGSCSQERFRAILSEHDGLVTFDDGLLSQYDIAAPILDELGRTGHFFVCSSPLIGKPYPTEVYRWFRERCFGSTQDFYDAFAKRTVPQGKPPLDYLDAYPFYTEADRWFRYMRDQILGPERYAEVMAGMMADYMTPGVDDLWMNERQIRHLHARGHTIGLHSHTHPTNLAASPLAAQRAEYGANAAILRDITGERPTSVSHPCGSYTSATLEVLHDLGVTVGFRSDTTPHVTSLECPREDQANLCVSPSSQATSHVTSA
jgi:peptidoglycan/xylan/chitin deacetylase (PgdA/CDA1 family)